MSFFGFPFGDFGDFGGGFGGGFGGQHQAKPEEPPEEVDTQHYYDVLGVDKKADANEIRKAYRKKAVKLHPDKGGSQEAFQELQNAYEVLSDENKRKVYDKYGEKGIKEGMDGTEGAGFDIFDILNGRAGRGKSNRKRRTKNVLQQINVTLEEVYTGKDKYFETKRYRICETCKGTGSKKENADTKCKGCNGSGVKIIRQRHPLMNMIMQTQTECNECNGTGYVIPDKDKCPTCKGEKILKKSKLLHVMLDKGAPDGKRYTFRGESDEVPDCEPGDVIVEINIQRHKKFVRKGADLYYKVDISLLEALTGFEVEITHLDNRKILVKTQPGEIISPGVIKTVEQCGMPFFESPARFGNLYLEFNIIFPKSLNNSQQNELKDLFKEVEIDDKIDPSIKEKYTMVDYDENDENTYATGGRKPRKNSEDEDDEEMGGSGARRVECANQ